MKLSIIIPTYNRLWGLPDAIASCPTGADIEIIVIDDGSTDGTWDWLQAQMRLPEGHRIVACRQTNAGKPAAANAGFALARGTYVRFLDSDDLLVEAAVTAQIAQADSTGADIVVAGYTARYEPSGQEVAHDWGDCGDFLSQQLGEADSSHYSAYLFRRSFLAGQSILHRPEFAFRDDRMFVIECALRAPVVVACAQPALVHRHHDRGRIQFQAGSVAVVTNWQEWQMWRRVRAMLIEESQLTKRRATAMSTNLWQLATRIGAFRVAEGKAVLAMLQELNPDFRPGSHGRDKLYRLLGFSAGQRLVNLLRSVRDLVRSVGLGRAGGAGAA